MNITQKLLPVPSKRRSGQKIGEIKFIVCHDTGNDGSTANGNVSYYINSAHEDSASAHVFVDYLGAVWCIPKTEKAWHVRYISTVDNEVYNADANDHAIGVELCYGSHWTPQYNQQSYSNYVELIAMLCDEFKLDPDVALVAHKTLDPGRKVDPFSAFNIMRKTWPQFISDVKAKVKPIPKPVPPVTPAEPKEEVCVPVPKSKVGIFRDFFSAFFGKI